MDQRILSGSTSNSRLNRSKYFDVLILLVSSRSALEVRGRADGCTASMVEVGVCSPRFFELCKLQTHPPFDSWLNESADTMRLYDFAISRERIHDSINGPMC